MLQNEDLLADVPPPLDDEPTSLRQDIVDELSDHLACAFHRELVKSGDDATARQRVLAQFGDPQRIARQLWFQAMWSRIMFQRVALGAQVALIFVLMIVGGVVFSAINRLPTASQMAELKQESASNRAMLSSILGRLPQPGPLPQYSDPENYGASASGMGMMGDMGFAPGMEPASNGAIDEARASLKIKLVDGVDPTLPVSGCAVAVQSETGELLALQSPANSSGIDGGAGMAGGSMMFEGMMGFGGGQRSMMLGKIQGHFVDESLQGRLNFGAIDPGRYTVFIEFPDGRFLEQRIAILPQEKRELVIPCPEKSSKTVVRLAGASLSDDLKDHVIPAVNLSRLPDVIDGVRWEREPAVYKRVELSTTDGLATNVTTLDFPRESAVIENRPRIDLTELPAEQRFIVLPAGKYTVTTTFFRKSNHEPLLRPVPPDSEEFRQSGLSPDASVSLHTQIKVSQEISLNSDPNGHEIAISYPESVLDELRQAISRETKSPQTATTY